MQDHLDAVTCADQCFVDRIVYHFVDQVMKGADVCAAHVHTRAPTYCLQTLQNLNLLRAIWLSLIGLCQLLRHPFALFGQKLGQGFLPARVAILVEQQASHDEACANVSIACDGDPRPPRAPAELLP